MNDLISDHDLTHLKLDKTREDVRRLHPLLQLLDPEQQDVTTEFAERLIGLLIDVENRLAEQATAFRTLATVMEALERRIRALEERLDFLLGEIEPESDG
ncbi:hypothetical protein SAMN05444404_0010 [Ruegeria lacuscaerulensis ITI-1157]|nr:hypothetical protein SAMN05444404_0010 [Ruegeria lacuscaerulensis ITI-1157]